MSGDGYGGIAGKLTKEEKKNSWAMCLMRPPKEKKMSGSGTGKIGDKYDLRKLIADNKAMRKEIEELKEEIQELGGIENVRNIVKNLQITMDMNCKLADENVRLCEKTEHLKSLNRVLMLNEAGKELDKS